MTAADTTAAEAARCLQCGYVLPRGETEALCPACLISAVLERGEMPEDDEPGAEEELPAQTCGGYELLEVIGRGGMGIVYRARKPGLDREVALKMIAAAGLAEPDDVRRFRQEADVIARMSHPNIVTVHDSGEDAGRSWFVMQLARGGTLAQRLEHVPDAFTPRQAAQMLASLSRAVECAHGHGVLHRDLKPANILLAADGTPLISDFGLARLTHGPGGITLTGAALGTPAYMAPEQASGNAAATTASDVYGLGAVLYHLLAGQAPFSGGAPMSVLQKVLTAEPPALPGRVPADLAVVCGKAMSREPGRRYRSAADLADDLDRWLSGEPVQARPAAWPERLWKWGRRHPVAAALAGAGLAGAVVLGFVIARGNELLRSERNVAVKQAGRAEDSERAMALNVYAADMFLARRAYEDGHLGAARDTLQRHVPAPGAADLRGYEWHALHRQCQGDAARTLATHAAAVPAVAFSPDGRTAVTGGRDGALRFWNPEDGSLLRALPLKPGTPPLADFATLAALPVQSPEVAQVLAGSVTFEEVRMRARPSRLGEISAAAWSPDGKWVATAGDGAYIRLWRTQDWALQGFIPVPRTAQLSFTPDSAEIVIAVRLAAAGNAEIRRYSVSTLTRLETIPARFAAFALAARVPGMAVPGDSEITMRSVDGSASVRWHIDHPVHSLALSPDGSRLAVFGPETGTLRHTGTGEVISGLNPGQGQVRSPVFSSDGRLLAVACSGQAVALFQGETGRPLPALRGHTGEVLTVAFRPDTSQILSGSSDHSARLWLQGNGSAAAEEVMPRRESLAAVTADGQHLLGEDQRGRVFCAALGGPATEVSGDHPRRALAIVGSGGDVRFLTRRTNEPMLEWWHADAAPDGPPVQIERDAAKSRMFAVSSDGRMLAVSDSRNITLHDTRTGRVIRVLPHAPVNIESLRLSADGSLLIAREYPCFAAVADTATGEWLWRDRLTSGTLGPLVFSPDLSLLVSGADDAILSIRRARTGEPVTTLREHLSEIVALAFTPDGRTLASTSKDRTLRLWHVPTWRPLGPLRRDGLFSALWFTQRGLHAEEYDRRWLLLGGE